MRTRSWDCRWFRLWSNRTPLNLSLRSDILFLDYNNRNLDAWHFVQEVVCKLGGWWLKGISSYSLFCFSKVLGFLYLVRFLQGLQMDIKKAWNSNLARPSGFHAHTSNKSFHAVPHGIWQLILDVFLSRLETLWKLKVKDSYKRYLLCLLMVVLSWVFIVF